MIATYLIGEPGAGKSTLLRELVGDVTFSQEPKPFGHLVYWGGERYDEVLAVQLGGLHETFPGTDRLSMGVQPKAIQFVTTSALGVPSLFAEGDRLATDSFFTALDEASGVFDVVLLDTPPAVCAERRAERGPQNDVWVKGRRTKVARLAERWAHKLTVIDGSRTMAEQIAALRELPGFVWTVR